MTVQAGLTLADCAAFRGPIRPYHAKGGDTLYRFSERHDGGGSWWIPYETFRILYDEARDNTAHSSVTSGTEFRRLYRKYLAISIDWNLMVDFFRMDIPAGTTAVGYIGTTNTQPFVSSAAQSRHEVEAQGILPGGLDQVFLTQYDITWVRRISL